MSKSKTKLLHTYPGEPPFECSTGDMTGDGLEIVIDKRTHELVIPEERETEEAVVVIVRPRGAPEAGAVTAGAGVPGEGVVTETQFMRLPLPTDTPVVRLSSPTRDGKRAPGPMSAAERRVRRDIATILAALPLRRRCEPGLFRGRRRGRVRGAAIGAPRDVEES